MLTAPFATVRYIASHGKRPANRPRLVVLHTNAGGGSSNGDALFRWINSELAAGRTPTQPHHQVDLDGTVWQWLDYDEKGVASVSAEGSCISVETQDYGSRHSPIGGQAWTPAQIEALAKVCVVAYRAFGVPLIPATAPDGVGIGWHSMWGDNITAPNPWTTTKGKTCPGAARIAQVPQIIARARQLVQGDPIPAPIPAPDDPVEDDVADKWLIQVGGSIWLTDGITRRGVAPVDIDKLRLLGQLVTPDPIAYTQSEVDRILDVSPGVFAAMLTTGGRPPSAVEVAVATANELARRVAS